MAQSITLVASLRIQSSMVHTVITFLFSFLDLSTWLTWGCLKLQFLDTFSLNLTLLNVPNSANSNQSYEFTDKGITWSSDQSRYGQTTADPSTIVPPPNWRERYPNGYSAGNIFDPTTDEHFQVWMRTSWFPTFRKLYAKYTGDEPFVGGQYMISVDLSKCAERRHMIFVSLVWLVFV